MDGMSLAAALNRQHLADMIRSRAIITAAEQRILSPNGREQGWLMDLRRVTLDAEGLAAIGELFWDEYAPSLPFQVGGIEASAIPIVSAIQLAGRGRGIAVNGFIVRKERKDSGLARRIEGEVTDAPIIIVDDVVNSASSLEKVRTALADCGRCIDRVFSIVDYRSKRGQVWFERHQIASHALFGHEDFGLEIYDKPPAAPVHSFSPVWQFASPDPDYFQIVPRSSPVSDGATVYFGSDAGVFWAIDAVTGEPVWSHTVEGSGRKGIWSTPALHEGQVYFGAYDGCVYCLDAASGRVVWRFEGADWVGSSPALAPRHGLLLIGLEHAVPGRKGGIAALDMADGTKRWELVVPDYVHASPLVEDDEHWVACGTNGGTLWCLEMGSGRPLWRYKAGGAIKAAPAHDRERNALVVGSFDGLIHVVDVATGEAAWTARTGGAVYTTPLLADGRAFVGSTDKHLHVLDLAERKHEAKLPLWGKIYAAPRLVGDSVMVGSTGGIVACIDRRRLVVTDRLQMAERVVNAILFMPERNLLVVPTVDNRLFAFALAPAEAAAETLPPQPDVEVPPCPSTEELVLAAYQEGKYFRLPAETGAVDPAPIRRLLGAATMLWMGSGEHRGISLAEFQSRVAQPLESGHARVFLRGLEPIGYVSWAGLSAEAERKFQKTGMLDADDWRSGDRLWLIDVIAPEGLADAMVAKLRRALLKDAPLRRRRNSDVSGDDS